MHSHASWSISLGRWWGIPVRLHILFVLFAVFTLFLGWNERSQHEQMMWIACGSLAILFLSVIVHELGHLVAALHYGGDCDEIVVGPLGGFAPMPPPLEARGELLMHLAGPAVNLLVCVIAGGVLFAADPNGLVGLLHPLAPQGLLEGAAWIIGVKLLAWINGMLLLVNLLPTLPFDGGRALRAWFSILWPDASPRRTGFIVSTLAKVAALALVIVAWLVRNESVDQAIPLWFSLLVLAIFLYFGAKQEEEQAHDLELDEDFFGYDFSQGYTSLERSNEREREASPFTRWLEERRQAKLQRQREIEEDEERRADEILGRLHEHGMESLSDDERLLLKRVSARYRQRNSNQS